MFWHCVKHKKRRDIATKDMHKIFNKTAQQHGPMAREHLGDILENNAFQHTGICPEDVKAFATHKQAITKDDIFNVIAEENLPTFNGNIIGEGIEQGKWEQKGELWYLYVYTDGSTITSLVL